jgi:isocitrate/isopropylmalate dehydrogenase
MGFNTVVIPGDGIGKEVMPDKEKKTDSVFNA